MPPQACMHSLLWPPYGIRQAIIFLPCGFFFSLLLSSSVFFFPRLISAVTDWLDVYHTSTHDVALVRIYDAGLKRAAHGWLKIQDAKNHKKFAICAPSHNFVGLYLRKGTYRQSEKKLVKLGTVSIAEPLQNRQHAQNP